MTHFALLRVPVGAEQVVRRERASAGWAPAFARPGLLTFRLSAPLPLDAPRPHVLARGWGRSLGRAASLEEAAELLGREAFTTPPVVQGVPGEAGGLGAVSPVVEAAWAEAAEAAQSALAQHLGWPSGPAAPGQAVLEVVVRPEEPWVLGLSLRARDRGPLPGGAWPLVAPEGVPSRSWAKLEELLVCLGRAPKAGDLVLELGAAPGGATRALLARGARVLAVDPVAFSVPEVGADRFRLVEKPVELLERADLPDGVRWLVVDVSQAAPRVVNQVRRLLPRYRRTLRGVLLTLKLPGWDLADRWPTWQRQLRELGLRRVEGGHLPSFRQEVGVWASF